MIFVTGPLFAGKQEYIMQALGWDQDAFERLAVRDVQDLAAHTPEEELPSLADRLAEKKVVIATEVGGGVVPMDPDERRSRESAGRLSCLLATRADTVIRVCCGLPRVLKGEELRRETREQQAQERERMRREFSANVSHELKTPLTSINGFAELMSSGLCDEGKMIEFAGDIYRESQRLIALVNDIIRISELDEGAVQRIEEKVDLVQAAKDTINLLSPVADRRRISISMESPAADGRGISGSMESPVADGQSISGSMENPVKEGGSDPAVWVVGSEHLIREMFYNLCDNAVKYNRDGGSVLIKIWREGEAASVSFTDTGIGIPSDEQDRVFERFYRVDKSHSRTLGGTGLGLSIVKHAAQFHDASVEMESSLGKGTTITVRFPVDSDAASWN